MSIFETSFDSLDSTEILEPKQKDRKTLRLLTVNFQGFWNKKDEIEEFLVENDIDIVLGSESHLKPSIKNAEILPGNYMAYRKDRIDGWGGAIIIAKKDLIIEEIEVSESPEIVAIKLETFGKPVIMVSFYRPPKYSIEDSELLNAEISRISKKYKNSPIWIGGDMNLPDIEWEASTVVSYRYPKTINENFLEFLDRHNMEQLVRFPTRGKNTLDILFTNRPSFLNRCKPAPGFGDHETSILADIKTYPKLDKPVKRKIYLWNKANIIELRKEVNTEINRFIRDNNINTPINDLWNILSDMINKLQDKYVPSRMTTTRYSQPWITRECKQKIRQKKRAFNKA